MRRYLALLIALLFSASAFAANTGTIVGSPTFGTAKFSTGLTATTDANYISFPSAVSAQSVLTTNWTFKAWLKTTATATQVAMYTGADGSNNGLWAGVNASGHFIAVVPGFPAAAVSVSDSTIVVNDGNWHWCEIVVSGGSSLSFYVDGTRGAVITGTYVPPTSAPYGYFGRYFATGYGWTGSIDEATFWNTATQTGTTSTVPTAAYAGTEAGLVDLYHLDGNATDSSTYTPPQTVVNLPQANIVFPSVGWDQSVSGHAIAVSVGNYFRANFTNSAAGAFSINLNTAGLTTAIADGNRPMLTYAIDRALFQTVVLSAANVANGYVTLSTSLPAGTHYLHVWYRSNNPFTNHWVLSSPNNSLDITGFTLSGTGTLVFNPVANVRPNLCFFNGDSMTEAEGTEAAAAANYQANMDATHDYLMLLALASNCEYGVAAFGGQGWTTAAADTNVPGMTSTWNYMYSGKARSFAGVTHFYYNMGTNGATIGTAGTVATFLTNVRAALVAAGASTAKIIGIVPFSGAAQSALVGDFSTYQGGKYSTTAAGISVYYSGTVDPYTVLLDTQAFLGANTGPQSIYGQWSYDGTHLTWMGNTLAASALVRAQDAAFAPVGRSYTFF